MKVSVETILVDRAARQRREITDIEDMCASMARIGQINPIVLDGNLLVAGERRLEAAKKLGWVTIEAKQLSDLTTTEAALVELDENIRRKELPWQDRAAAILTYHEKLGGSAEATASSLGLGHSVVSDNIIVAKELRSGNPKLKGCTGVGPAINIIGRQLERAISSELDNIGTLIEDEPPAPVVTTPGQPAPPPTPKLPTETSDIIQGDFLTWAPQFTGRPFNLLHCDFPYGINHDKSEQGNSENWGAYADTPDTYFKLCKTLIHHKERLLTPSAHVMFWFSMNFYQDTIDLFSAGGFEVQPFPLIWHKTDNKGIMPDPERQPRRVYETALLMSLGDRKIIRAVSNAYGCPTSKTVHLSEKPEPMLKQFFQMLCDEFTELLDPTCGSANALIAAERLGARRVLGLELNPDFVEGARQNLKAARAKDKAGELL